MVSFIVDKDGIKTHAVIPIDKWEKMKVNIPEEPLPFADSHVNRVITFIKENNHLDVEEWQKAYSDFYSYYNKLDMKDILALYLFRSSVIEGAYIENDIVVYDAIFTTYPITNLLEKDGSNIKEKSLKILKEAVRNNSELYFLEIFNKTVQFSQDFISEYKIKNQRLRRDAERDRLFIYDLEVSYALSKYCWDKEFQSIFTDDENITPGNLRGLIRKYIADHLYNGNKSQVSRAASEGEDRINKLYNRI